MSLLSLFMMEEDIKQISHNTTDQLYHLLKRDTFTFCLICLEDINSTSDDVGRHLKSKSHAESIKCLFKACHPSLLDEIEDEKFADMVFKSVFDISVLLEKESCYVCKKEDYWFCLMCEKNVTECYLDDSLVKDNIIEHVLSDCHVKRVKEVCFLYRLNDNQDFLLLNKSVVYCSICKDVMLCQEVDLLRTSVVHLEMKHPYCAISNDFLSETNFLVKNEVPSVTEEGLRHTDERISDDSLITTNFTRNVSAEEVKEAFINDKSLVEVDNSTLSSVQNHKDVHSSFTEKQCFYYCMSCKNVVKLFSGENFLVSLNNHFQKKHLSIYLKRQLESLIKKVVIHNDSDKIKLLYEKRQMQKKFMECMKVKHRKKRHARYILQTKTDYVCILCLVSISPFLKDNILVLDNCYNHMNSLSHRQCDKEKQKLRRAISVDENNKAILVQLTKEKDNFKKKKKEQDRVRKKVTNLMRKELKRESKGDKPYHNEHGSFPN